MTSAGKHIERLIRRAFIRSVVMMPRRNGAAASLGKLKAPRILLLRHDRIGDALVSTPVVALLRERFPDAAIDILLGAKNRSVAPLLDGIDEAIAIGAESGGVMAAIGRLRRGRYDAAINLLAKDSASGAMLTALSGAAVRIGFEGSIGSLYDHAIAHPAEPAHIVRETSLLLAPFGIEPIGEEPRRDAERLAVRVGDEARRKASDVMRASAGVLNDDGSPAVIINISGSGPEKYWGRENYIALAGHLRREGMRPVIASSPSDAAECAAIADASGAARLPAVESYETFAAMLDTAGLVVTPDTSVVHLAAALRKPTVMLVGMAPVGGAWGPWGVPSRIVAGSGSIASILRADLLQSIQSLAHATMPAIIPSSAS